MKKKLIIALVIIVLAGAFAVGYALLKKDSSAPTAAKSRNCSAYHGKIAKGCTKDYIGLALSKAKQKASDNGLFPVVASVDGKPRQILDVALNGTRPVIYFEVNDNHVTKAYFEKDRP